MYRHASSASVAPACCVNYTSVRLYAGVAWLCVNNGRELANCPCGDNVATLCEKAYNLPCPTTICIPLMLRKSRPKTLWGKDHHWQRTCEFMKLQCSLLPFKWPSPSPISQIKRLSTPGIQIHTLLVYGHNSSFKRVQDEPEFTIASAFTEPLVTGTDQLVRQMSWWGEEEPCHPQLQIWDTMDAGMAMGMLYFGLEKKSGLSLLLCGGWYIVHKLCNTLVH